jgi:hypothetical protein
MPEGQQEHRKVTNTVAPFTRYFEDVSHLGFGQEILGPRVDGALSLDNCFHYYHIPRRRSFVRVFLYFSTKMLRAKNGFSGSDGENEPVPERRKVKSCLDAVVIRVYDEAGNVIETHEHNGEFKQW